MIDPTALEALPVFPLPNVVLMPEGVLPLHIFEERYRAMLAHVRSSHGLIAMGTLLPDGGVYPVAGVGELVECEDLPNGRANIVLRHVGTVMLEKELDEIEGYRRFRASQAATGEVTAVDIQTLRPMVVRAAGVVGAPSELVEAILELKGMDLVHGVAPFLLRGTRARLAYLEQSDPDRVELVSQALAMLLAVGDPIGEA